MYIPRRDQVIPKISGETLVHRIGQGALGMEAEKAGYCLLRGVLLSFAAYEDTFPSLLFGSVKAFMGAFASFGTSTWRNSSLFRTGAGHFALLRGSAMSEQSAISSSYSYISYPAAGRRCMFTVFARFI